MALSATKKTASGRKLAATKNTKTKTEAPSKRRVVTKKSTAKRPSSSVVQSATTSSRFTVKKEVRLSAPPAVVWDALTNPEKTKQYFFNCEVFSDWKAGSAITWKGTVMLIKKIELHGTIVKVDPQKLLIYKLKNENTSSVSTVTEKLTASQNGTILSVSDDVGVGEGAADRYKRSEKGWTKVLKGLKKVVEKDHP